jgi:3-hydroxybutyrate dehydrogenase
VAVNAFQNVHRGDRHPHANNTTEAEALEDTILKPVAIKRLLEPEEVSALVVYLASDLAGGITGSAITIDCGWTAR